MGVMDAFPMIMSTVAGDEKSLGEGRQPDPLLGQVYAKLAEARKEIQKDIDKQRSAEEDESGSTATKALAAMRDEIKELKADSSSVEHTLPYDAPEMELENAGSDSNEAA